MSWITSRKAAAGAAVVGIGALLASVAIAPAIAGTPATAKSEVTTAGLRVQVSKSVLATMDADAQVTQAFLFNQVAASGTGAATVSVPVGANSARNLNGFSGIPVSNDTAKFNVNVNGSQQRFRSVTNYDTTKNPLPATFSIKYFLDGKAITAQDLVGKSGNVTAKIHVANNTVKMVPIPYTDLYGKKQTKLAPLMKPLVGTMQLTLPGSFSTVTAPDAVTAGDGHNGTLINWTLILYEPLGKIAWDLVWNAKVSNAVVPAYNVSMSVVAPSANASSRSAADQWTGGVDATKTIFGGAGTLASNVDQIIAAVAKATKQVNGLLTQVEKNPAYQQLYNAPAQLQLALLKGTAAGIPAPNVTATAANTTLNTLILKYLPYGDPPGHEGSCQNELATGVIVYCNETAVVNAMQKAGIMKLDTSVTNTIANELKNVGVRQIVQYLFSNKVLNCKYDPILSKSLGTAAYNSNVAIGGPIVTGYPVPVQQGGTLVHLKDGTQKITAGNATNGIAAAADPSAVGQTANNYMTNIVNRDGLAAKGLITCTVLSQLINGVAHVQGTSTNDVMQNVTPNQASSAYKNGPTSGTNNNNYLVPCNANVKTQQTLWGCLQTIQNGIPLLVTAIGTQIATGFGPYPPAANCNPKGKGGLNCALYLINKKGSNGFKTAANESQQPYAVKVQQMKLMDAMVVAGADSAFGNATTTNGTITTGGAYSVQIAGVDPTSSQTMLRAILGLIALALGGFVALVVWRRRVA
jgi:hypothetical protein